jgi:SAM-dependent methyltransferase
MDIGCGAGLLAADMASRGLRVVAIDGSEEMLGAARQQARIEGLAADVAVGLHDVHALGCRSGAASLVTALGVIPWLRSPDVAVAEMARLVAPGGYLLVSSDNSLRLVHLLDPRFNPVVLTVLSLARRLVTAFRLRPRRADDVGERRYRPGYLDQILEGSGLEKVRECSVGFGRFTFRGRPFLSEPSSLALHRRLQQLADRDAWIFRRVGNHTMVLARKPG